MGAEAFLTLQIVDFAEGVDDRVAALLTAGTGITITYNDGAGTLTIANTGLGGSTGSTDNRILRADGPGGSTVQASVVTIDDSGNISGLGTVGCGNVTIGSGSGGSLTFNNAAGSPSIANLSNAGIRVNTGAGARGVVEFNIAQLEGTGYVYWLLRGILASSANGVVHVHNFNLDDSTADQVLVLGPGTSASNGVRLKRAMGSTTLQIRNGNDSAAGALDCGAITASGLVTVGTYTVATLPSAAANAGALAQVTDSSVTTNGSAVSGGGANRVVVFSNGSAWDVVVA